MLYLRKLLKISIRARFTKERRSDCFLVARLRERRERSYINRVTGSDSRGLGTVITPDLDYDRRTSTESRWKTALTQREQSLRSRYAAAFSLLDRFDASSRRKNKKRKGEAKRNRKRERNGRRWWLFRRLRSRATNAARRLIASSRQIDIVSLRLVAAITHIIYAREHRAGAYGVRARERKSERASERTHTSGITDR